MTSNEKAKVKQLHLQGLGATRIAKELGLSVNTVKAHLRRHAPAMIPITNAPQKGLCKQCGKPVGQKPHRKEKLFCCDACRMAWWNNHRKTSSNAVKTCAYCGRPFNCYGKAQQKYCSHNCYINARFGGDETRDTRTI